MNAKTVTGHELGADGQHQSRHAYGEQNEQREYVVRECLDGQLALVAHAKLHGQCQTHQHDDGRKIEDVEMKERSQAVYRKLFDRKPEHEKPDRFRRYRAGSRSGPIRIPEET